MGGYPDLVIAVVGPTAVGKSGVAIELAAALGGHVVNADAFQVYRGMDIGTAKVPLAQRRGIPHHMLDVAGIDEDFGVARFQRDGRDALRRIARAGCPAVVVGGSGLYVRGLLDDLQFPGTSPEVRSHWEAVLVDVGAQRLHSMLALRDPAAAAAILPTNTRRVVRALEVIEITGGPFPARFPKSGPPLVSHTIFGLSAELADLDVRIASRVTEMVSAGLVEEVAQLSRQGLNSAVPAGRAIGYAQVLELLAGRSTLSDAVAATVTATSQFARRQMRWFRSDPRVRWLEASASAQSTAEQILAHICNDRA